MPPHVIQSFAAATGVPGYGRIKLASVLSSRRDVDSSEGGGMWQMQIQIQIQLQSSKLFSSFAFSPTSWALHKEYPVRYGIMIGYGKGTGERDRNMEKGIVTLVLGIYSFAAPLGGPTFVISL
jgi:hypothetical protein